MSRSVTTFIIIPPRELAQQVAGSKRRLEGLLSRKFHGYVFNVSDYMDFGADEDYVVLPIMNYIDDSGKSRMCEKPALPLLQSIVNTCRSFDEQCKMILS